MSLQNTLSRREREIMEVVYLRGTATLSEILAEIQNAPTRPALRSLLTILEGKGQLKHRKEGREFVYLPVHSRRAVGKSTLNRVISTFFGGSLAQAVAAYLSEPQAALDEDELAELKAQIEKARQKTQANETKGR